MVEIPVACPRCGAGLRMVYWVAPLRILKRRTWWWCGDCGYEIQVEQFKKAVLRA